MAPLVAWESELTLCPPKDWTWTIYGSSSLVDSVYIAAGYVANYPLDQRPSDDDLAAGELRTSLLAWDLDVYIPELFEDEVTVEAGVRAAQETIALGSTTITGVGATDVDGFPAWYFVETHPASDISAGITIVGLLVEINAEEGWVLDYSAALGGVPAPATTNTDLWEGPLADYWIMLQTTLVEESSSLDLN